MKNTFENIIITNSKGYFFSFEYNGLFEMDMDSFSTHLLTNYERRLGYKERLFANLKMYNDWIILIPMSADDVFAYNVETKEKKYIELPLVECEYKESAKFFDAYIVKDSLFIIGHGCPYILELSLITWDLKKSVDLSYDYKDALKNGQDIFRYGVKIGESIILPSAADNDVYVFNAMDRSIRKKTIEKKTKGFSCAFSTDCALYMVSTCSNDMTKCGYEIDDCRSISFDNNSKEVSYPLSYSSCLKYANYEVIIPLWDNDVILFDESTMNIKRISVLPIIDGRPLIITPIRCGFVYNNNFYIVSGYNGDVFTLDLEQMSLLPLDKRITINDKLQSDYSMGIVYEDRDYGINDFINDMKILL